MLHGAKYIFKVGDRFRKITREPVSEESFCITKVMGDSLLAKSYKTGEEKLFSFEEFLTKTSYTCYEFYKG